MKHIPLLPGTWLSLHTSLCLFFSCSHWTISTSASTVRSWNTGHTRCDTNRSSASRKCSLGMSKWKFVWVEAVKALLLPPLRPRK